MALAQNRTTPENIQKLYDNEIFVFGSNEDGRHGKGAAKLARDKFGARPSQGAGRQGQTYAIPTKDANLNVSPLYKIKGYILRFETYAAQHPELRFFVTEIGCGLAGYTPEEIAPLFSYSVRLPNVFFPQRFWDVLRGGDE